MTHSNYTRTELVNFSISELRAICTSLCIARRRSKEDCITDILAAQPQPVAEVKKPEDPNFQANYDKAIAAGFTFHYTERGWKGLNNGMRYVAYLGSYAVWSVSMSSTASLAAGYLGSPLHQKHLREAATVVVDEQVVAQAEEVEEKVDDYLFHDEQQPTNLPQVGDTHLIGDFLLRCIEVGSEDYVTVWDVSRDGKILGEIKMGWDCIWSHTLSFSTFATPQEAVIKLWESLQARLKEQQQQNDEPITFEKVADDRWEETVNGVQVTITAVLNGYKTNLTGDTVFDDFGVAIKQSLVAVAKLQEKRLAERTERANTIEVLEQCGSEFIVKNSENGNHYTVRLSHLDPNQRCECADCHHRSSKCKHQIAVENFLKPSLIEQVKPKSCSVCWGSGELGDEDWLEQCYYCNGKGTQKELVAA